MPRSRPAQKAEVMFTAEWIVCRRILSNGMFSLPGERLLIHQFLCIAEAERVFHTLRRLSHHDTSGWALAGGMAVEIHCLRAGRPASIRPLNDIDFVAPAFDYVPETLADEFLFRHVHPFDPPG